MATDISGNNGMTTIQEVSEENPPQSETVKDHSLKTTDSLDTSSDQYVKIVIRGIPRFHDTLDVEKALKKLDYPVIAAYRMHLGTTRKCLPIVLVHLTNKVNLESIFKLKRLLNRRIRIENFRSNRNSDSQYYSRNGPNGLLEVLDESGSPEYYHFDDVPEWEHMRHVYFPWYETPETVKPVSVLMDWEGLVDFLTRKLYALEACKSWFEVMLLFCAFQKNIEELVH